MNNIKIEKKEGYIETDFYKDLKRLLEKKLEFFDNKNNTIIIRTKLNLDGKDISNIYAFIFYHDKINILSRDGYKSNEPIQIEESMINIKNIEFEEVLINSEMQPIILLNE